MKAADVAFMIGHDDDIVLNPSVGNPRRRDAPPRSSNWAGMQSDVAIVSAVQKFYPSLVIITLATVEELRATNASMVVIISYKTQPSFAWYSTFFETLNGLEARGTIVYPSCNFKQLISSKANYVRPLIAESQRALDALPPDGPHDPKILMRVDWGTGEPLLAASSPTQQAEDSGAFRLDKAIVKKASSLAAPERKLQRSLAERTHAPLVGPLGHFINEIEIHPGYYVDWDDTPDETIEPLARAYGEYITRVLSELGRVQYEAAAAQGDP
ncbi:hypothetical protein Ctob_001850 [Chrysochromulina tobinii]|uniref:Uncharacterized protein n=1 Tax=Chrysochromulina tobinii TaxID=1460289 RepID=A0A0M0J6S8_9EUKA|nr:hypothetical protein Ctob_001850 [Chrysochromulina tobinii]|eukprot:KOO21928.1 hypothetical protein Ctob_001850 [Chrysochromulina sp. CCMP291]